MQPTCNLKTECSHRVCFLTVTLVLILVHLEAYSVSLCHTCNADNFNICNCYLGAYNNAGLVSVGGVITANVPPPPYHSSHKIAGMIPLRQVVPRLFLKLAAYLAGMLLTCCFFSLSGNWFQFNFGWSTLIDQKNTTNCNKLQLQFTIIVTLFLSIYCG